VLRFGGTYSILQPELAQQLRTNKLRALESGQPERLSQRILAV
jgi:hypothetical protein